MKLAPFLTPYTKANSELIQNLKLGAEVINLFKRNIGINFSDLGLGNGFLDITSKAQIRKN